MRPTYGDSRAVRIDQGVKVGVRKVGSSEDMAIGSANGDDGLSSLALFLRIREEHGPDDDRRIARMPDRGAPDCGAIGGASARDTAVGLRDIGVHESRRALLRGWRT